MAHKHSVYDSDTHFTVNPITRTLKNEGSIKTTIMQYDHNSERFTFEIPRYIERHDMSQCNRVEIHYRNGANSGMYVVDDFQVSPNGDDAVICSWLISQNATRLAAALEFRLTFKCIADDGSLEYMWSTAMYKGISVSSGIHTSEDIVEQHADVLEQWRQELIGAGGATDEQVAKAVSDYLDEHPVSGGSVVRIAEVDLVASAWVGAASPYSQVVNIPGVTMYSQVDLTPSVEQLAIFHDKDLSFVTENENGIVTVYAIGQKPENDYVIQVTIKEVST